MAMDTQKLQDKIDGLEWAMSAIDDAIEAIKELNDVYYAADIDCLADIRNSYKAECTELADELAEIDAKDIAALEREYYRGLL